VICPVVHQNPFFENLTLFQFEGQFLEYEDRFLDLFKDPEAER